MPSPPDTVFRLDWKPFARPNPFADLLNTSTQPVFVRRIVFLGRCGHQFLVGYVESGKTDSVPPQTNAQIDLGAVMLRISRELRVGEDGAAVRLKLVALFCADSHIFRTRFIGCELLHRDRRLFWFKPDRN